jgi:hypothetical protein
MIKDHKKLQQFEKNLIRNTKVNPLHNFRIIESLHAEATALGVFPLQNPLEGIEVDIKIARVVNSVSKSA